MSGAYEAAGVDYDVLDQAKRIAQARALLTSPNAEARGARVDDRTRGEPATIIEIGPIRLGVVLECLGTKSMIAEAFLAQCGIDRFDAIGYDTVAAAVNDCCCVGALPIIVHAYFATGAASFYTGTRHASLVSGFGRGCDDAGAAWGGGESPTLSGLVDPSGIDLAASALGLVPAGLSPLRADDLAPADAIVLVASSGLHANGASLARVVADDLDEGFATVLPSGRRFGDALLDESVIYTSLLAALFSDGVPVHYASHITGHGLRKIMRGAREFTYRVHTLPPVPEVLTFVAERAGLSDKDAYGTLNMGAGFALFVAPSDAPAVLERAAALGYAASFAGVVEDGPRRVLLEELDVVFDAAELDLR